MIIPDPDQLKLLDKRTIEIQGIRSLDLMERAALKWLDEFLNDLNLISRVGKGSGDQTIHIFCGPGNNGGDGLVVARHLMIQGFSPIVYVLNIGKKPTEDHLENRKKAEQKGITIIDLKESAQLPEFRENDCVIDALFGFGFVGKLEGFAAELVEHINTSNTRIYSIDIPSGLPSNENPEGKTIVRASVTFTFHSPKLSFFFPENAQYTGRWKVVDIGLEWSELKADRNAVHFILPESLAVFLKPRAKFSHKGDYGHALLLAGGRGKVGAAQLSGRAALKSGCGLLTIATPLCGEIPLQTALPEAMVIADAENDFISMLPHLDKYDAIGAGPGIGLDKQTGNMIKLLIQQTQVPLVLDADALNILAENKTWMSFLPAGTILTPHPGEFDRLFGRHTSGYDRYITLKEKAQKHNVIIVLKGAYTCIAHPDGSTWFNSTGNPGMAKGGSGDVLTGVILGLLARGYSPFQATMIGVWLHGKAGDLCLITLGQESVLASNICEKIADAFSSLERRHYN